MTLISLPVFDTPCIYADDFNCQHTDWGYNNISPDRECFAVWPTNNDLTLLQDPKGNSTFHSGRWKSETSPDLAFARTEASSQFPDKRVLGRFPRSQYRPSVTTASHRVTSTSKPVKRWDFRRANWKRYGTITNNLPLPDARNANTAYQAFCSMTMNAAKQFVCRGKRKLYMPCWEKECKTLFQTTQAPTGNVFVFFVLFAIFILHLRESKLYRYTLDGKSALAWELPFSRFMGHLSST